MNLNSDDIYNNIESFRNKNNLSQDKMAEIIGMSGKSAYSGMIKYKRMKFEYLINLINNSSMTIEQLFRMSTKSEQCKNNEGLQILEDGCPNCREKDKEISKLKSDLLDTQNKYIHLLEKGEVKKEIAPASNQKAG